MSSNQWLHVVQQLIVMIINVSLTAYGNMRYPRWWWSHHMDTQRSFTLKPVP